MKKILLFAALAAFASCSSDDSQSNPVNEPQPIYTPKGKLKIIKNIIHLDSVRSIDGVITRFPYDAFIDNEYIYGENGFLTKATEKSKDFFVNQTIESSIEYVYKDGKVTNKRYFSNGNLTNNYTYTYTNNLITREESGAKITNFIYNPNNEVVREEIFTRGETKPRAIYEFTYESGNIISISLTMNNTTTKELFKYDDKNNPNKDMYPEALLKILRVSKNNPINDNFREYSFEYNSDKYPIKRSANDNYSDTTFEYFK